MSDIFLTLPETRGNNMSLFQYFQKRGKSQSEPSKFCQSLKDNFLEHHPGRRLLWIQESLLVTFTRKLKCAVYDEKWKQEIEKYASTHAATVRKLKGKAKQAQSSDFTPTIENALRQQSTITFRSRLWSQSMHDDHSLSSRWRWYKYSCR